jgi:polysaccharide export outer membrane protein
MYILRALWFHTFVILYVCSLQLHAQSVNGTQNGSLIHHLPSQPLGPNDLLHVDVYGSPDLTRSVRVDSEGNIRMPMLGEEIEAGDLTASDLENRLARELKEEELLVDPIVSITVLEYASRPISVLGSVKTPTTFQADQPISLAEAITRAGGLTEEAGAYILVTKNTIRNGEVIRLTRRVSVKSFMKEPGGREQITLRGGEDVRVPEAGNVYIVGSVEKPGTFALFGENQTSLMRVLAMSGGLKDHASGQAYIYRRDSSGQRNEIPVDLKSILKRKSPDLPVLEEDIVYIPESGAKKIAYTTLEKVIGFGTATLSGVLIWGSR